MYARREALMHPPKTVYARIPPSYQQSHRPAASKKPIITPENNIHHPNPNKVSNPPSHSITHSGFAANPNLSSFTSKTVNWLLKNTSP